MNNITKYILSTSFLVAVLQMTGCTGVLLRPPAGGNGRSADLNGMMADQNLLQQKTQISTGFASNPDTDAWHEQRQKISLATGDRIFDKDFGRVYDSLVLAVSTLELKVNNMERTSGYIQATGIALLPTESKTMKHDAIRDWCIQKGFDPAIPDKQMADPQMESMSTTMADFAGSGFGGQSVKAQKGLTFQLVKMGDTQTKVKLRFSDVFYPAEMEAYYKLVWQAVDKQIFVDKNVEGAVEERK